MATKISAAKPFKIGVVVNEFFCDEYPPLGGFGLSAKNFAEFFQSQDRYAVEVVALLPAYRGKGAPPTMLHGTRILPTPPELAIGNPRVFKKYRDDLLRENMDLLISIDYYPNYFQRLMALPRTPWIHWIRDPHSNENWDRILGLAKSEFPCEYSESARARARNYLKLQISRRLLRRKFHCGIQETWLQDRARDGFPLIGKEFSRLVNRINVPKTTVVKDPRPNALFIGRLVPVKRPWIYFELARRFPEVEFNVVGEPDHRMHLTQILKEAQQVPNLRFLGKRVGHDLEQSLEKAWVLVNTSIHEGMPQSVLQALAFETPVVSALDFGGSIASFGVYAGECSGDGMAEVDSFARALQGLLQHEGKRRELGRAGRQFVQANYTDAAFLDQFLAILSKMEVPINETA